MSEFICLFVWELGHIVMEAEKSHDLQSQAGDPKSESKIERRPKTQAENRLREQILSCSGFFLLLRSPVNCMRPTHNEEGDLLCPAY